MADADLIPLPALPVPGLLDAVEMAIQDMGMVLESYRDLASPDGGDPCPSWLYVLEAHFQRLDDAFMRLRGVRS
jgi:hypothetical protein